VIESLGSITEEVFVRTETRAMRCGAAEDRGCGMVRRRRGRRLLIGRRLLLLGRLLGRLLRCFLRCHEHSTPLRFQNMVIGYVWYSRVCAVSKILSAQFGLVDGNRDQLCTWRFPTGPECEVVKS